MSLQVHLYLYLINRCGINHLMRDRMRVELWGGFWFACIADSYFRGSTLNSSNCGLVPKFNTLVAGANGTGSSRIDPASHFKVCCKLSMEKSRSRRQLLGSTFQHGHIDRSIALGSYYLVKSALYFYTAASDILHNCRHGYQSNSTYRTTPLTSHLRTRKEAERTRPLIPYLSAQRRSKQKHFNGSC